MTNEELEELGNRIDKAVDDIREFGAEVQILASVAVDEGTKDMFRGRGNWYARTGMAREFLSRDTGQTQGVEIARKLKPNDEDEW